MAKKDVKVWDLLNPLQPRSDSSLIESRLDICRECDRFESKLGRCMECGCIMRLKTTLVEASCPLGKW